MGAIDLADLKGFKPPEPLNKAWYDLIITAANTKENTFRADVMVTDGPTQTDDSSPVGRKFAMFRQVGGYPQMKDGGVYCKTQLLELLKAVDLAGEGIIEDDDWVNKEFKALIKAKPDNDGIMRENVLSAKPM